MKEELLPAYEKCLNRIQDYFEYRGESQRDKSYVMNCLEELHESCKKIGGRKTLSDEFLEAIKTTAELKKSFIAEEGINLEVVKRAVKGLVCLSPLSAKEAIQVFLNLSKDMLPDFHRESLMFSIAMEIEYSDASEEFWNIVVRNTELGENY